MAGETLLTLAEVLASLPDNVSQLINPLDIRNQTIALSSDVGFLEEDFLFTIPVVDGTFVSINPLLSTADFVSQGWSIDGNNALYVDFGVVTINPPTLRLLSVRSIMILEKSGGGTSDYSFQFFAGGVPIGRIFTVGDISSNQEYVILEEVFLFDYSAGITNALDVRVRGDGTGDDLQVEDFDMKVVGTII